MSQCSASVMLCSSTLTAALTGFFFYQTYVHDRWRCLNPFAKRRSSRSSFVWLMSFAYAASLPTLLVYFVVQAWIKYRVGVVTSTTGYQAPVPYTHWPTSYRGLIRPLYFCVAVSMSLEQFCHSEELYFWIFLIGTMKNVRKRWEKSWELAAWLGTSVVLFICWPVLIAISSTPYDMEAHVWFLLVICQLCMNIYFTYLLFVFPSFLRQARQKGASAVTLVRLSDFHNLNKVRILCRYITIFSIGIPAFEGEIVDVYNMKINANVVATDLLLTVGVLSYALSSCITILIFYPRSVENGVGYTFVGDTIQQILPHPADPLSPFPVKLSSGSREAPSRRMLHVSIPAASLSDNSKPSSPSPTPTASSSTSNHTPDSHSNTPSDLFTSMTCLTDVSSSFDQHQSQRSVDSSFERHLYADDDRKEEGKGDTSPGFTVSYDYSSHPELGRKKSKRNVKGGIVVQVETSHVVDDVMFSEDGLHPAVLGYRTPLDIHNTARPT